MKSYIRAALPVALIGAATLFAGLPASAAASAPLVGLKGDSNHYIVVLKDAPAGAGNSTAVDAKAAPALKRFKTRGVRVQRRFSHALNGFSADLNATQLDTLRADPAVSYVSREPRFFATDVENPVGSWGLDRIDQRTGPLDYSYGYTGTGAGVTAFILDTGIRSTHSEFTGRISPGFSGINDSRGTEDCNGHGTHVAGTVGGTLYGVAKKVTLVPVRVLNCDGGSVGDSIIAGIEWVTAHHSGPSVANMSLAGGGDQVTDDAITSSIASGVTYVVAAANAHQDACGYSPARLPAAITVGATTIDDQRSDFSNYGSCLDLFAPGSDITSAWNTGDNATYNDSGTSMASPHVAGEAALYLQAHPQATAADVSQSLTAAATPDAIGDVGAGSPNLLLFHQAPAPVVSPDPPTGLQGKQVNYGSAVADDSLAPVLDVLNETSQTIPLSSITVRYWFTQEHGTSAFLPACDYTPRGCANLQAQVIKLHTPRPSADSYLNVAFTAAAGSLQPHQDTGLIQLRVQKQDYSAFNELDDWSYNTTGSLASDPHVTVYVDGKLAWGVEP